MKSDSANDSDSSSTEHEQNTPNTSVRRDANSNVRELANGGGSPKRKSKKVLGVQFAPLDVPWERRRETLAVFIWISTFFVMGPMGIIFLSYLFLFTRFGFVSVLYLAWLIYDKETCNRGGRRSAWLRNWRLWKWYNNYYPIHLVKTTELDPSKNYLFGSHPHGVLCSGAFGSFATEGQDVGKVFPGITPHLLTLEGHYSFPFYREFLMSTGCCSASKSSMNYLLSHPDGGHAAVLVVGGAPESLDSHPDSYICHLKNRKGFIKLALRNGASLVPVFSFGETNIYDQVNNPEGGRLRKFQNKLQRIAGLAPVLFLGRGVFQYSFGLLPQRKPIYTVVGKPIPVPRISEPSQEDIDAMHTKYVEGLKTLFYTYRDKYDDPNAQLTIT